MEPDSDETADSPERHRLHARAALLVSVQSALWTIGSSALAIALGLHSHTVVLVALGAIGFVDALGSIALVYHFHHALRHDALSENIERLAHRIVLIGLLLVGLAAIGGGIARLATDQSSEGSKGGVLLATASVGVLTVLSARKRAIAARVASHALLSDAHLSVVGAAQAGVALAGMAVTRWVGWHWADAAATTVVGCVAATLAVVTWLAEARPRRTLESRPRLPAIALGLVSAVAVLDALLGSRLVLIGLLVTGPALSAVSLRPVATALISVLSIVLAVALGAPDRIWMTSEHAMWIAAVGVAGSVNTVVTLATRVHWSADHARRRR